MNEPLPKMIWIHISCGLWTPEIYLEEKKTGIVIKGVENIDPKRYAQICSICKTKS
jgi:PHD-like zinc-binding domain